MPFDLRNGEPRTPETMECPICGATVFESKSGIFYEDDQTYCPECLTLCRISVDDGRAWINANENMIQDVGQPRCNGEACLSPTAEYSNGVACKSWAEEHIGKPCCPDCPRFLKWC